MPQVGLRCVRGLMPHHECRTCALDPLHPCMLGPDALEKLRADYNDPAREPESRAFTPTRILGCSRQAVLQDTTDYYTDVDDAYPLFRGNMMHAMMEAARYPGVVSVVREHRFRTLVPTRYGPQRFSAKCDLIVVRQVDPDDETLHVAIVDYKTTSKIGHDFIAPKPEHVWQLNMYAWIVTRTLAAALGRPGATVVVDSLELEYFSMEKPRRFTTAGPLVARGKRIPRTKPWQYETLTLDPIPRYPLADIERAVVRRIEQRLAYTTTDTLPPILPEEDRWKCMRCPVMETCYGLEDGRSQDDVLPSRESVA